MAIYDEMPGSVDEGRTVVALLALSSLSVSYKILTLMKCRLGKWSARWTKTLTELPGSKGYEQQHDHGIVVAGKDL